MSKKSILITVIALVLAVALIGSVVYISYNKNGEDVTDTDNAETPENESEVVNALDFNTIRANGVELAYTMRNDPGMAAAATYLSTQVSATVTPADAPDKSVDWSVVWDENASRKGTDISQYVTVEPTSDGSNVANVYCHKPFTGDFIYLTVTTRAGGYTATARVQYVGIPETLSINKGSHSSVADTDWGVNVVELDCNKTYYFDLNLDNTLHSVGTKYGNYSISLEGFGAIKIKSTAYNSSGTQTSQNFVDYELSAANQFEDNGSCYTFYQKSGGMHIAISCSIENGKLKVQTKDAAGAYYAIAAGPGGKAVHEFDSYVDGKLPYTAVTVTDTISGLSATINIRTDSYVTGVSVNGGNDITF